VHRKTRKKAIATPKMSINNRRMGKGAKKKSKEKYNSLGKAAKRGVSSVVLGKKKGCFGRKTEDRSGGGETNSYNEAEPVGRGGRPKMPESQVKNERISKKKGNERKEKK